ncbi:hypothetical protein EGI97_21825, partial [Stutzerimonas xanthomarina]
MARMNPKDGRLILQEQLLNLGVSESATQERLIALARFTEVEKDETVIDARRPVGQGSLIHHSDRGVQYVSIRY